MSKISTKLVIGLFSAVSAISFFATSAFAEYLNGKWNVSTVYYEDYNLESKYSDALWYAADKWNGISKNIDIYPADKKKAHVKVKHLSRSEDNKLGFAGTYGLGIPYNSKGEVDKNPYASGEVIIVRYLCDKLDEGETINTIAHEFGHILGLAHTTKSFTDSIMDPNDVFDVDGPTKYDKDNLKNLYK
ncbi:matrixin family metalloprotease [Brevibacillus laterosporus]